MALPIKLRAYLHIENADTSDFRKKIVAIQNTDDERVMWKIWNVIKGDMFIIKGLGAFKVKRFHPETWVCSIDVVERREMYITVEKIMGYSKEDSNPF